jgi:hypothetical protein
MYFFGVYLTNTELRSINSTEVKLKARKNEISSESVQIFNNSNQGHCSATADRIYHRENLKSVTESLQATVDVICEKTYDHEKPLAVIKKEEVDLNKEIINMAKRKIVEEESELTYENNEKEEIVEKKRKIIEQVYHDWGLDHADYKNNALRTKWSEFEKNYIKSYVLKIPLNTTNKWELCLNHILNSDENVRRQFHIKHIQNATGLKDAIRPPRPSKI